MTKRTTFTAIAADGSAHTRTSKNRTYTYAILTRRSYEHALAQASQISTTDKKNHDFHVAMANGTDALSVKPDYRSQEDHDRQMAGYKAHAAEAPNRDAYAVMKRDARVLAVEAMKKSGVYDRWSAITWCGRPDLASKELSRAHANPHYADAVMAEAKAA